MKPFDDDVVATITEYMNENQPEVNLLIVQVHGAVETATDARLTDVGGAGARFTASTPGGERTIDVAWSRPITRRDQIREELFALYLSAS